jgi:hypothetical protein
MSMVESSCEPYYFWTMLLLYGIYIFCNNYISDILFYNLTYICTILKNKN